MAVDIVPRKATGAALGVVGVASYCAAGIQDVASGWLIDAHITVAADGTKVYGLRPRGVFLDSSIRHLISAPAAQLEIERLRQAGGIGQLILIFFGSLLGSEPSFCRSRSERADAQTRDEPAFSIAFRNRRLLPDRVRPGQGHTHV